MGWAEPTVRLIDEQEKNQKEMQRDSRARALTLYSQPSRSRLWKMCWTERGMTPAESVRPARETRGGTGDECCWFSRVRERARGDAGARGLASGRMRSLVRAVFAPFWQSQLPCIVCVLPVPVWP